MMSQSSIGGRPATRRDVPALQPRTSGAPPASGSDWAFKVTFATLLVWAALGFTSAAPDANFPASELRAVLLRVMGISGLLFVVAVALPWARSVSNAALASATLASVFTAYLIHTELFHPSNRVWMIMALAACWFALFTAFRVIDEFRWGAFALVVAAACAVAVAAFSENVPQPQGTSWLGVLLLGGMLVCAGPLALHVLYRRLSAVRGGIFASVAAGSVVALLFFGIALNSGESRNGHHRDKWVDHPNVRFVEFKETPNLYFVSFDAIIPEAIMQKYMGIDTTDFHQLIERDMRRFRNMFANAVPTWFSLNTMMALDQDVYLASLASRQSRFFSGRDLSPLIWILRRNGYVTTSIYENTFFGEAQGPNIDNYVVNRKSVLCSLLDEDIRTLAFWGYCWKGERERLPAEDFLVRNLSGVDSEGPEFVIAHYPRPGHTSKMFDYEKAEDRERFLSGFEERFNRAAIPLERIMGNLRENAPDSILFVYGDHGAFLSQGLDAEDDPAFFLQDRFGILGAVYPPGRCEPELDEAERKGYVTSLDVLHAIIECLSGGQSPLREPRRDRFWTHPDLLAENHPYTYGKFLYE